MNTKLSVWLGDITHLQVDVIVNAANAELAGGGGVDGAIHRAAGAELYQACRQLGGCETGDVKATPGFQLPVRAIFHAVGPVWRGGQQQEATLLSRCYRRAIALAEAEGYRSMAFPAISCGVYGYPLKAAASIAIDSVRDALSTGSCIESVIFCCFDQACFRYYEQALAHVNEP